MASRTRVHRRASTSRLYDRRFSLSAPSNNAVRRCHWVGEDPLYIAYHDREWGFPVSDDRRLFEKICLEGFQAGLSWRTILGKRDAFRDAFAGFDFIRVARFGSRDVERLLRNAICILLRICNDPSQPRFEIGNIERAAIKYPHNRPPAATGR